MFSSKTKTCDEDRTSCLCFQEVVTYILETGSIAANARDNAGYTALHESCVRGHLRVARLLVSHGADVNAAALDGTR